MQWWNQHSRVNLVELKAHIVKKLGVERSKLYFHYLNKFLDSKLSKAEFNKLCFRVLGKEYIPLHNQLICSILKNACNAKAAPPKSLNKEVSASNGDLFHDFSTGNVDFSFHKSTITSNNVASEDGEAFFHHATKILQTKQSIDHSVFVQDKERDELSVVEDKIEISAMSAVVAPLGIPYSCQTSSLASIHNCVGSYDSGALLGSHSLRERMQQIAAAHGIDGVSIDSANLLNYGLDVFLKRLIKSCAELIPKDSMNSQRKPSNGFLQSHNMPVQSSSKLLDVMQGQKSQFSISLPDFKVAMQLTPQQLGKDWPLLLEKIMDL